MLKKGPTRSSLSHPLTFQGDGLHLPKWSLSDGILGHKKIFEALIFLQKNQTVQNHLPAPPLGSLNKIESQLSLAPGIRQRPVPEGGKCEERFPLESFLLQAPLYLVSRGQLFELPHVFKPPNVSFQFLCTLHQQSLLFTQFRSSLLLLWANLKLIF